MQPRHRGETQSTHPLGLKAVKGQQHKKRLSREVQAQEIEIEEAARLDKVRA